MRLEWILHPAVQCGLEAAGLSVCLYLFLLVKRELRAAELRLGERQRVLEESAAQARETMRNLERGFGELQDRTGLLVPPAPAPSGLNLGKRGQVLRMFRRGESPARISASLALPRREVELVVKVQQLVLDED